MEEYNALALIAALVQAYYGERDMETILNCVTDDIIWVGTENNDSAHGKEELRALLEADVAAFPDSFEIELEEPVVQWLSDSMLMVWVTGHQIEQPGVVCGFSIRGTATCVKTKDNDWLIANLHTSVPNAEPEKYNLARELDETRKKEQTLMASIPGGAAIYRLKKDGRFATDYVSEGLAKMLGYPNASAFLEVLREDARCNLVPEDIPDVLKTVSACIEQNRPIHAVYRVYTREHRECTIRLDANAMPEMPLGEDDVLILYAVHTSVSEESKNAMLEQQHYRTVLEMLGIAYWEWSKDNGFYASENYSNYALSRAPLEDVRANRVLDNVVHPNDFALLKEFFEQGDLRRSRASVVLRMCMVDESYQWTEIFGFKEYDENGGTRRMSCTMRNVDAEWIERNRRLQTALDDAEKANRAKTDFLSRVSHDMRTPLNGILGLTALLKDSVAEPKVLADITQLELSGRYLLNLINDTLDVSRIESGRLELHPIVCDGRKVFNNVLGLSRPNIAAKRIQFHLNAENLPFTMLYIDVGRVEQIVMNILGNAVKFTPEGGSITVTMKNLSVEDGVIVDEITVQDTGIGMSDTFLPHLFEPFVQENSSTTNPSQGTGLGMTITKQLIEKMGGTLSVQSAEGKGTCFTFTLPMRIATEEQIDEWKREQNTGVDETDLTGKHVLLCEDHPLNVDIATRLLSNKGMVVDHAADGEAGVALFAQSKEFSYDAILMDIRMPKLDGMEAARAIRALPRADAQCVPIIAMTANAFEDDVRRSHEAGMNDHLSKPIDPGRLYTALQRQLHTEKYYRRQKVLVVDDKEINRAVIRAAIEKDYELFEAESGTEALALLQEERGIDAVITDIQMPGVDGVELIRQIRANPDNRYIAIIANTQFGEQEQEEQLLALGADDFIYKPTTPKIMQIRVRNALRRL